MSEVFLCATGQLSARSRSDLRKAGIVVVEVEDPKACTFIQATSPVSADDMLWACLDALNAGKPNDYNGAPSQREALAVNMLKIVVENRRPAAGGS